jgi:modulator of FtsH protease
MVGGATAALSGLVFVALSLNIGVILRDATHRSRSIGTLTNFTGIFTVCALALMGGQNHAAIGAEWLVVSIGAAVVFVYPWPRARRESPSTLMLVRFITAISLYVAQVVGSAILVLGATAGLCIAAASMTFLAIYSISGAWLLLVSAHDDGRERSHR